MAAVEVIVNLFILRVLFFGARGAALAPLGEGVWLLGDGFWLPEVLVLAGEGVGLPWDWL